MQTMAKRIGLIAWMIAAAVAFSQTLFSQSINVSYDEDSRTWMLSNGAIEAQYALVGGGNFRLVTLAAPGGKQWVSDGRPISSPVYFRIDRQLVTEATAWEMLETHVEATERGGFQHIIRLRNSEVKAEVILHLQIYPGQPFVRTYYSYHNLDEAQHYVTRARTINVSADSEGSPIRAFYVNQVRQGTPLMFDVFDKNLQEQSQNRVSVFAGAYADSCTWLALRDASDNGLVFGWEFNGRSRVDAQLFTFRRRLAITGGPQELNVPVPAGGELSLPAAFVGLFHGDWDEAGYRTQRFTEAVIASPLPDDNFPYLMYNTWGYQQNIDETTLRRTAEIAASIGVEVFTVDLGWARQIGLWQPDPVKFPSGFREFADYVHSLGMKLGVHFVPSEAAPDSPLLLRNPGWRSSVGNDYFEANSICLANAPAQAWMREVILRVITRYGVDWVTQDGENLVKQCDDPNHTHDAANSNWANSVQGIDALVQFARANAPDTLWENNADGGTMSTFEAVKNYATFGSCDACQHQPRRQAIYGMSYVFPPRFVSRYMEEPPIKFTTRSSMFGGPWILMQRLTELTPAQIQLLRDEGALYKSLRGLIRDGKVFHLTGRPDGFSIEAMESFNADLNRGVVFVYRPNSPLTSQTIFPRGLNPNATYRISFRESRDSYSQSGASVMASGIRVKLPDLLFAEIVYITGQ
jgi:alpha-galactosidase